MIFNIIKCVPIILIKRNVNIPWNKKYLSYVPPLLSWSNANILMFPPSRLSICSTNSQSHSPWLQLWSLAWILQYFQCSVPDTVFISTAEIQSLTAETTAATTSPAGAAWSANSRFRAWSFWSDRQENQLWPQGECSQETKPGGAPGIFSDQNQETNVH